MMKDFGRLQNQNQGEPKIGLTSIKEELAELVLSSCKKGSKDDFGVGNDKEVGLEGN